MSVFYRKNTQFWAEIKKNECFLDFRHHPHGGLRDLLHGGHQFRSIPETQGAVRLFGGDLRDQGHGRGGQQGRRGDCQFVYERNGSGRSY